MRTFSHLRFWFWKPHCYTAAQTQELRALQTLHTTHLAGFFEEPLLDILALQTAGNNQYSNRFISAADEEKAFLEVTFPERHDLLPFADSLFNAVKTYSERRRARHYGAGHSNDPTRLFTAYLQAILRWLATAPTNTATLHRVNALVVYLTALQNTKVFTHEPKGYDGMPVLLDNLKHSLESVQARLHYQITASTPADAAAEELKEQHDPSFQYAASLQISNLDQLFQAFNTTQTSTRAASLRALCAETPLTPSSSRSSGLRKRSTYLHNTQRLLKLGNHYRWLHNNPSYARSAEGHNFLAGLQEQLRQEIAAIDRYSATLSWYNRASLRFFTHWREAFEQGLRVLTGIERNSQHPPSESEKCLARGLAALAKAKQYAAEAKAERVRAEQESHQQQQSDAASQRAEFKLDGSSPLLGSRNPLLATDAKEEFQRPHNHAFDRTHH